MENSKAKVYGLLDLSEQSERRLTQYSLTY